MSKIRRPLGFINLLDLQGNLSLTNMALLLTLINALVNHTSPFSSSFLFVVAVANYIHKRKETNAIPKENPSQDQINALGTRLDEMSRQLTALSLKSGMNDFNG